MPSPVREPSLQLILLAGPRTLVAERLEGRRGHYMPASLLDSQLAALEPLEPDEPGVTLPGDGEPDDVIDAVVASLDG